MLLQEFDDFHKEELADVDKYLAIAERVPEKYKGIFRDISREEKTHADVIEEIIEDYKSCCPNEEEIKEKEHIETEKIATPYI